MGSVVQWVNSSVEEKLNGTQEATTVVPVAVQVYCVGFDSFHKSYALAHGYVSLFVCLFGLVGNSLSIVVLTRKEILSSTNAILTGLAVADNVVLLEYIPYVVHMYFLVNRPLSEKFSYPWSLFVLIHSCITQVFHTISIWLTVLLAVWRYLSVAYPLYSRQRCTLDRALVAILIAYIGSPILCLPQFFSFTIKEANESAGRAHSANATSNVTLYTVGYSDLAQANGRFLQNANFWTYSVVIKIIPCITLTILSIQLIRALISARERRDKLKHRPVTSSVIERGGETNTNTNTAATAASVASKSKVDGERGPDRTTRMLVAVLVLFLITEFPQGILALLSGILGGDFFKHCYSKFGEIMDILALVNSAINFILYYVMSAQFRQTFLRLYKR